MEALIEDQRELQGRMSRTVANVKKVGAARRTGPMLASAIVALNKKWDRFEERHDQLRRSHWEALKVHDYHLSSVIDVAEGVYLDQRAELLKMQEDLTADRVVDRPPRTVVPAPPRTTLPKIEIPKFSGRFEEWPSFRDLFQTLIVEDIALANVTKLHYLKVGVKGEAASLINGFSTTEDNFARAWDALSGFYDNQRLLVRSAYAAYTSLPKLRTESAEGLRKLFLSMTSTVGSLASIGRPIHSSEDLFVFTTVEMLDPISRREWEASIGDSSDTPSYATLKKFLEKQLHTLEAVKVERARPETKSGDRSSKPVRSHLAKTAQTKAERDRCALCHRDHFVMLCEAFKKKTPKERRTFVVQAGLCWNCLGRHRVADCLSTRTCTVCSGKHHTALHESTEPGTGASAVVADRTDATASCHFAEGRRTVLLATARIALRDHFGNEHHVRALIDQGSDASMVTEALVQRLRLPRERSSTAIFGVGGRQCDTARGVVTLRMTPRCGGSEISCRAIVLPRITVYAGLASTVARDWPHLRGIPLADPDFMSADPTDILLGADAYATILRSGVRRGSLRDPIAQETIFGWIVSGPVGSAIAPSTAVALHCGTDDSLAALIRGFWEQAETTPAAGAASPEDLKCEEHYARTHRRKANGRYSVRLPCADDLFNLEPTRALALRMLHCMERRFSRDASLSAKYSAFMREYEELGHMTRVCEAEAPAAVCYLPHHGVLKGEGPDSKLRVVFNGSAALGGGKSLNKKLFTGPNLLPALSDVLLRWRRHRVVFTADIEKMYRQIEVHRADRDLQRILWRADRDSPVVTFRLNTVTYGLACAPFLAIRTLQQLAEDEERRYPLGAAVLRRDTYVDDVLAGGDSVDEAAAALRDVRALCMAGGFPLKKWAASNEELLREVPMGDLSRPGVRSWSPQDCHTALGLQWHPAPDVFSFRVRTLPTDVVTKRTVVSQSARLFDPMGWLAPATIRAKTFIQGLWLRGLDWDSPLADNDRDRWCSFVRDLGALEEVRMPRWMRLSGLREVEIHGFADASERAYAAVVYFRTRGNGESSWTVALVAAKTKVSPLKQVSLPRLELCAAVLLVRLVAHVKGLLALQPKSIILWSDSTVTLGWIRRHPSRWTTYVANRVSEIQLTLPEARWLHVAGAENPADCASRGVSPSELVHSSLWWRGPAWLSTDTSLGAGDEETVAEEDLPEARKAVHAAVAASEVEEPEWITNFSSLSRLTRVVAWCLRWRRGDRVRAESLGLSAEELRGAMLAVVRCVQAALLPREVQLVASGAALSRSHWGHRLSPFLDSQGVLRVGGRLRHSLLSYDEKHPAILPRSSHLGTLLISFCHTRALHGGVQQTLGLLRQQFWLPGARAAVKKAIHRCVTCVRWRAAAPAPFMADLPSARVRPSRAFQHTGVDYAGPLMLRAGKGRGRKAHKAFVAVFVCLCTRAVHLEVVSDYTSEAFLATLRRFVSRRGLPQVVYSDCGTNFAGAEAELREMFRASSREAQRIHRALAEEHISWRFNPPAAPHFGGLWEAAVKSAKHHLRRVVGSATLTFEEMTTLVAGIEACLNSRPLAPLSDDPDDISALTPGHFLVGSAPLAVPEPTLLDVPSGRLSRWQLVVQMRDHF
ncbi:uncharacterized protein [Cardiocondyla obscurior]|uniref:uncharacterized protein n=1 Tax=Cardiocondyla obscurior TaxID=286306 RepID=UPI0039658490